MIILMVTISRRFSLDTFGSIDFDLSLPTISVPLIVVPTNLTVCDIKEDEDVPLVSLTDPGS